MSVNDVTIGSGDEMGRAETYLGDGLYASFDGWQFCLRAPRYGEDHSVYLEPSVLAAFLRFVDTNKKSEVADVERPPDPR